MSEEHDQSKERMNYPERSNQVNTFLNWLRDFFSQFQLAWRLLLDRRVPLLTKIIPLLTVLYVISPIDLIPDVALGFGQLDDLAIFLIGLRLFVDVCPPALVEETKRFLEGSGEAWAPTEGPVIDVEAEIVPEEDKIPSKEGDGS